MSITHKMRGLAHRVVSWALSDSKCSFYKMVEEVVTPRQNAQSPEANGPNSSLRLLVLRDCASIQTAWPLWVGSGQEKGYKQGR